MVARTVADFGPLWDDCVVRVPFEDAKKYLADLPDKQCTLITVDALAALIAGLPAAFDGYRIAQISDLHCGPFASGHRVAGWVDAVNRLRPDAIAAAKALIPKVAGRSTAEVRTITASAIALRRVSKEGQEGLRAFLEKRKAVWSVSKDPR